MEPETRRDLIAGLTATQIEFLIHDWPLWARDKQLPPAGDWRVWLLMAGRGFGKTRTGAQWINNLALSGKGRHIGLVGDTMDDVRHVMVEGASGILACVPDWQKPDWQPSLRRLVWPNGIIARCFSADDPEQLRGPEFDHVWADEIAKWRYQAAWDNLMLALRVGDRPRALATTTPRPLAWLAALAAAPDTILVQGSSTENRANLAAPYLAAMQNRYGGTALARQELDGVLTLDAPNALFRRHDLRAVRGTPPPRDQFVRMVIGVDPAIGGGDETGIIVVGKARDGLLWVLCDDSLLAPADQWIARLAATHRRWRADTIIAEVNQGGDLVRTLLAQAGMRLPVRAVRATRSKTIRAEPVAAAYARQQIRHAGHLATLEDQMCSFVPTAKRSSRSPDRMDALVWAVTALLGGAEAQSRELGF